LIRALIAGHRAADHRPSSRGAAVTRDSQPTVLDIGRDLGVPLRELSFSFSRSSGPGGQNVNKVNSKATLRWNARRSPSLSEGVKQRLLARYGRRLTAEGEIIVVSQRYRDQGRNVADCLDKLRELIESVAAPPKPRKPSRPTHGSKVRRLANKRAQSQRKAGRRRPAED
jgi:ribosome-associated protein